MKLRRTLNIMLTFAFVLMLTPIAAMASQTDGENTSDNDSKIVARAESTGYIYKEINGIMYKRLWSYTRGCWIDPAWTRA